MSQGPTRLLPIDAALFSHGGNRPGIYVAVDAYGSEWSGARVSVSEDDGVTWKPAVNAIGRSILGKAETIMGDTSDPCVLDPGNTVRIRPIRTGVSIPQATWEELLGGANRAILGSEVIQWETAVDGGDGTWVLSGFRRGRLGTEWATGTHAIGEDFAALPSAGPDFVPVSLEKLGWLVKLKATSLDAPDASAVVIGHTPLFANLLPLAPVDVTGVRNESNDLTVSWTRRTRFLGDIRGGNDIPVGETSESYVLEILSGDSEPEVLRTIRCVSPTAVYTAAEQAADGLTPGDPLSVRVCQVSSVIGRGRSVEATV